MKINFLPAVFLIALSAGIAIPTASAQTASHTSSHTTKKAAKSSKKKAETAKEEPAAPADEDDEVPEIGSSQATEMTCELGNKLTIYRNADDNNHIALRWKKQLLRLKRKETTTGANRFENRKYGWVWIDIPTKGMLLDAKKGQQLANECKSPEQMAPKSPA